MKVVHQFVIWTCMAYIVLVPISAEEQSTEELENVEEGVEIVASNDTISNSTEDSNSKMQRSSYKKMTCLPLKGLNETFGENRVDVLNATSFLAKLNEQSNNNVTNRTMPAVCSLVLFYASWCPFSAKAAPHYNALARLYPDLVLLAVDASHHHSFTTQFGVLALPTILLFHNAKNVVKYNHSSFEVDNFTTFVTTFTSIEPLGELVVTEADYLGPMPTEVVPESDIYLLIAWIFILICAVSKILKSRFCKSLIESLMNNWIEAEIQHEHND